MQSAQNFAGYAQAGSPGYDEELAQVGPGTPCGEMFRRYWQPVAIADDVGELPMGVRVLGEDLVLFKMPGGDFGLVHRQCPHRRASLEIGKCEERGIRCAYHGWLFAPDGEILETPGEAPDARPAIEVRARTRLGAYPLHQYGGLIFAYMGPPGEMPPFPEYDATFVPDLTTRNYQIN